MKNYGIAIEGRMKKRKIALILLVLLVSVIYCTEKISINKAKEKAMDRAIAGAYAKVGSYQQYRQYLPK